VTILLILKAQTAHIPGIKVEINQYDIYGLNSYTFQTIITHCLLTLFIHLVTYAFTYCSSK